MFNELYGLNSLKYIFVISIIFISLMRLQISKSRTIDFQKSKHMLSIFLCLIVAKKDKMPGRFGVPNLQITIYFELNKL